MTIAAPLPPNTVQAIRPRADGRRVTRGRTWSMLLFRLVGFAAVQALIAAVFALRGAAEPWADSVAWWPVSAIAVSLANLGALAVLIRDEGIRYADLLSFSRGTAGRDLLAAVLLTLPAIAAAAPIVFLPGLLYADPLAPTRVMYQPLPPVVAAVALVLFPVTVALSELPNYFGYVMPRLEALGGRAWAAVALPALFLALQHCALPLVFDWRFVAYRAGTFALFALLLGVALHWRPRLMPYLMVSHFLMDLATAWAVFQSS